MASSAPLYDHSIVMFKRTLQNVIHCMDKAEQYAQENKQDVESYTKLRIYPNMGDFTYQIQRMSDTSKYAYTRISKASIDAKTVAIPDDETTFQQLKDRLSKTIVILDNAKAEDFAGQEGKEIELFGGKYKFNAVEYLQVFAVPNFYFHVTTAYDLLRGAGVPLGKTDLLVGRQ